MTWNSPSGADDLRVPARDGARPVEIRQVDVGADPRDRVDSPDQGLPVAVQVELLDVPVRHEAVDLVAGADTFEEVGRLVERRGDARRLLEQRRRLPQPARELAEHPDGDLAVVPEHLVERRLVDPDELARRSRAIASAVRGTSSRIDISPKKSPFSRTARRLHLVLHPLGDLDRSRLDDEHLRPDVPFGEDRRSRRDLHDVVLETRGPAARLQHDFHERNSSSRTSVRVPPSHEARAPTGSGTFGAA